MKDEKTACGFAPPTARYPPSTAHFSLFVIRCLASALI
jgi:hypothetical protein